MILVCHSDLSTSEPTELPQYQAAIQWCVAHGFELIWWQQGAQVKGDSQHGGLLNEQTGIERIREALQAHTWPSMTMKCDKTKKHSEVKNEVVNKDKSKKDHKNLDSKSQEIIGKSIHHMHYCQYALTDKMLGEPPHEDEDKFEELFDKFMAMKETAQLLPHEQRKAYAEKVVMEFWQAIGGDEEEMRSSDENGD